MKLIVFFVLLLMYPLFLHWIHISDLRVVPLVIPYALGVLSLTILFSSIVEFFVNKWKKE
ncbi:hypothetical protein [Paenibacillus rigui]|uniref:Uncharacterized protein n=1 Tax=Paenibacillus rigui TaxID=554312 RepID=A0A229UP15_9BACL|nr:hypothetical protein [Paenibacillus rigui]OXM85071.1 hypothetical protein CF651_15775 [Paenibacillus rigui]